MNTNRYAVLILFVVLALPTASASEYYLLPDNSSVTDYGSCTNVSIWLDATDQLYATFFNISYDAGCAEVTSFTYNDTCFDTGGCIACPGDVPGFFTVGTEYAPGGNPGLSPCTPGLVHLGNFTICCNTTTPPCQTDVKFDDGTGVWNFGGAVPFTVDNGTFTCGTTPSEEPFSKPLYEGWNLISLPLVPGDTSASAVLSTVSYDAVYRYNATSKQFESAAVMDPGTGYFVHVTGDCTWEYSGTAYTSTNVPMEPGLNMIGWLNCSKEVGTLSSISDRYRYVARWNATAEKFEVYNSVAPAAFNDFTTMDRGTGYFISVKQVCTLSESC